MEKKHLVYGILVILLVSGSWWAYVWLSQPACLSGGTGNFPKITLTEFKEENQSGVYTIEVIDAYFLVQCETQKRGVRVEEGVRFLELILLDDSGETVLSVRPADIDINYSGNYGTWQNHSGNVSKDNGTIFPIHFSNEIDKSLGEEYDIWDPVGNRLTYGIYLSKGDKFMVYGSGSEADGPAGKGWSLLLRWTTGGGSQTGDAYVIP